MRLIARILTSKMVLLLLLGGGTAYAQDAVPPHAGPVRIQSDVRLSLHDAVAAALAHSPALRGARYAHQADLARADARRTGASNPTLSVEAEDFAGTSDIGGVNGLQLTTTISQDIELGGKPGDRRKARTAKSQLSQNNLEMVRQQLTMEVSLAFLDVLSQQERMHHAAETALLAQSTVNTIASKVDAGKSAGIKQEKAAVELAIAELAVKETKMEFRNARQKLAIMMGEQLAAFEQVDGHLDSTAALPKLSTLIQKINAHPELVQASAALQHQRALEQSIVSSRFPNLTMSLGHRWNNAVSSHAMVAGVGVPIPLFDRNKGNINAAAQETLMAKNDIDQKKLQVIQGIRIGYERLKYERERLKILRTQIIPRVETNYAAVEEGYRIGRFGYLDLLDAQRTLFDTKKMLLDAMIQYQASRIVLSYNAGHPLSSDLFDTVPVDGEEAP